MLGGLDGMLSFSGAKSYGGEEILETLKSKNPKK